MPVPSSVLEETEDVGGNSSETGIGRLVLPTDPDTVTGRPTASTANNNIQHVGEEFDRHEHDVKSQIFFGDSNGGFQAGVIHGNIQGLSFHYAESQSIFGSLAQGTHPLDTSTLDALARRARVQAGRRLPKQLQDRCYGAYATVKSRKIKSRLLQIARVTYFLDRGFAEYFHIAVLSFGKQYAEELLNDARKTISKIQNKQSNPTSADIGDLGHFCEQIAKTWDKPGKRNPKFTITQRRDEEVLHYLQDALEIPYWEFMVDIFLGWKANSNSLSGDVVLRVLHSAKLDLLDGRRRLLDEIAPLQGDDVENIAPIIDGIDARITVLDRLWNSSSSDLDDTHCSLASILERPRQSPALAAEEIPLPSCDEQMGHQMETVTLITLIILFLIAAIVPGYKAFAISMQTRAVGSTGDADFWYLIQSSTMAVMGNIIMVVPLLKKSWLSPAYGLMWAFFALGLTFVVISIILYPLVNPGWSFMVAFFGSAASAASVLTMTQATAREDNRGKVKSD